MWEKKIRIHILVFDLSTAVPSCPPPPYLPVFTLSFVDFVSHWWVCAASIKVKLTKLIAQQPYDLNLLVRAMDGEVRPQYAKTTQFVRRLPSPQFIHTVHLQRWWGPITSVLCLFQPINFPGLDESEVAHFLCSLQRLNKIAEVQMWRTMGNTYCTGQLHLSDIVVEIWVSTLHLKHLNYCELLFKDTKTSLCLVLMLLCISKFIIKINCVFFRQV